MPNKKKKKDCYVLCPFYRKEESTNVGCEGPTDNSSLVIYFDKKVSREEYQEKHCRTSGYKQCEVYKMLMKKYEK